MVIQEPNQALNIRLSNLTVRPAQGDRLNSGIIKAALTLKYDQGWAKAIRNGNVVIGTVDLAVCCTWIENVEFEVSACSDDVVIRLFADKVRTHWTSISYFTKGSELENYIQQIQELNEVVLIRVAYLSDASVCEAKITRDELFRILSSESFCIKLEDEKIVIIEFKTCEIKKLLKERGEYVPSAKIEQRDLQQNLEYNLNHRAKYYMQNPNLSEDLAEQFEKMKKRLVNEINLPRLINANNNVPKWRDYYY
ncbi:MAG: hypothetical protein AAI978_00310 [Candidatus Hodgkinia cicadicola]